MIHNQIELQMESFGLRIDIVMLMILLLQTARQLIERRAWFLKLTMSEPHL